MNADTRAAQGRARGSEHLLLNCRMVDVDPKERTFVSLLTRFAPPSLTAEQYDEVVRRLEEEGLSPADGLDYEIAFGSGDQLKVSLVWDSQEQFEAFAARLMPILEEFGINPGEPEVFEVHNIIKR